MRIHGLEPSQGETAYAFLVLRFGRAVMANVLMEIGRHVAPICPDAEQLIGDLPAADPYRILALPWTPPEAGSDVELQRRLLEYAAQKGVEEVWCFQIGTSVPRLHGDDEDDGAGMGDGLDEHETQVGVEAYEETDNDPHTQPIQIYPPPDDEAEALTWSNGAPPTVAKTTFPVDGYPQITEDYDWEDFGLALKLDGSSIAGEDSVLAAFHSLWLAPYGGRYRHANVTFDRTHHAVHLWVDRFEAPGPAAEMVGYLLWIASKLDDVLPVIHARFCGATMEQKYARDPSEAFVLGGNPLIDVHARGGDEGVDAWIDGQTVWSTEEVAQMLRELAIDIVTGGADHEEVEESDLDDFNDDDLEEIEQARTTNPVATVDPADLTGLRSTDEEVERARGSGLARMADELLVARAKAGQLDARARPVLLSLLTGKHGHRQRVALELLGWAGDRESVPAIIAFIETNGIAGLLESAKKGPLLHAACEALGRLGDARAIPVLGTLVAAPGRHNDSARPAAAHALATLLERTTEPRIVDEATFDALVSTIDERNDPELQSELAFAYGRLARFVPATVRSTLRSRIAVDPDAKGVGALARLAATYLAGGSADPAVVAATQKALNEALTVVGYSAEEDLVTELRLVLRIAAALPDLIDATTNLVALIAFEEPSIRSAAHALLERLGRPVPATPIVDRVSAQRLADDKLVELLGEPVLAGRACLIRETERRQLTSARGAVVRAAHAAIDELAAGGHNLARLGVLRVASQVLAKWPLESDTAALFQRMRRHDDHHVQEMAEELPDDVSAN
ncbi:MAG TPA: hypothetical protein VGM39_12140 [Kofleriaceae bacterium]